MVEGADIITIILSVITLLLLAGGIVLLVLSIRSTIRKKKRIGGIIGGSIMIVFSIIVGCFALFFLMLAAISDSVYNDEKVHTAGMSIERAVEDRDAEYLYGLFASEGYSGRTLGYEEAMVLIYNINGNVEDVKFSVVTVKAGKSNKNIKFKFAIKTSEGQYILYTDYITESSKDSYLGIHHVKLEDKSGKLCEYGNEPDFG